MDNPQFVDGDFVNGSRVQGAFNAVYNNFNLVGDLLHTPGLLNPANISIVPSGLNLTVSLPYPFAVVFGYGGLVPAHGTSNGQDTSTYSINLASLVPSSGSRLVYIVASYAGVGESIETVVGPPPGHPDYNPTASPFLFYTIQRDSLQVVATAATPDNLTSFELAHLTLSVGQSSIQVSQLSSTWQYASAVLNPTGVSAGTYSPMIANVGTDGRIISASTWSIPSSGVQPGTYVPATITVGADGRVINASTWTIPPTGVIGGTYSPASITVGQDGRILTASNYPAVHGQAVFGGLFNGTYVVPGGVTWIKARVWGGGGGGGGSFGATSAGSGGGGGAYAEGWFQVTQGQVVSVVAGTGGSGGSGAPTNGTAGGNSAFGNIVADGGGGGIQASNAIQVLQGGVGGLSSGGTFNVNGFGGGFGFPISGGSVVGGTGGGTFGTSYSAPAAGTAGYQGTPFGGGGGGGTLGNVGGNGAAGLVILDLFGT